MNLKYFFIIIYFIFSQFICLQSQVTKISSGVYPRDGDNSVKKIISSQFNQDATVFEGEKVTGDYIIGPEVAVTGATGFYDYQTNGECRHFINRFAADNISAVYTISTDSLNIESSRRTVYSFSTNDGNSWYNAEQVPSGIRSGFPSLTVTNTGEAVICNHYVISGQSRGVLAIDVAPLAASFLFYYSPSVIAWPGCSKFSNGLVLVGGVTYYNSLATDTGIVTIFNPSSGLFSNTNRFLGSNITNHSNMRWTYASGPDGKALYLLDPLNDTGGNNGYNRMFISFTSNSGLNWSPSMLEFYNPQVLAGEFAIPYLGLDAIYDSQGNYYIAFNTTNTEGEFSSARLWVSKNGAAPVLVAQHSGVNGIPEAASVLTSPQTGICTIDNPSLSLSSDGTVIYASYSVMFENDLVNNFNKSHIYISTSLTSSLQFGEPIKVTNSGPGSFDERYPSISQTTPDFGGTIGKTVYLVYQKDPQPGSSAFMDGAPVSRSSLVFRKITGLSYPVIGINNNTNIPADLRLSQNYPNPFNPVTRIEFELNKRSSIVLSIYDVNGRLIENIMNDQNMPAGKYESVFNGSEYSSGVYFVRLRVEDESGKISYLSNKMLLVK